MYYLDKILNRELKNEKNYCRLVKIVIFNRLNSINLKEVL